MTDLPVARRPGSDAERGAVAALKRFFFAVSIGDGPAVWEELGERARAYVLNLAVQQGMDFELGSRLRTETATPEEVEEYLANLVTGVRHDLDGIDLANLLYHVEPTDDDGIRVHYQIPVGQQGSAASAAIPAGSAVMAMEVGRWRVNRLIPRPGR